MIIECSATLDKFRVKPRCEFCGKSVPGCEPHHYHAKGMGGGSRLDIDINLIGLCRFCHQSAEDANISRKTILGIIADREKHDAEVIQEAIYFLVRTPDDSDAQIMEAMSSLSKPVWKLAERTLLMHGKLAIEF